jgi:hypothetical protein
MIIHGIEHHILKDIYKNKEQAKEEAKKNQNQISIELIEFYVEEWEIK